MKKIFKAVATVLATVGCLGTLACCKTDEKTITVGYTDYAPMNYTNDKGELVGFDTELAQKTFEELGYKVRFKEIEWTNKYSELESGTIDCIWNGFTANVADDDGIQRADKVDFTYNYMMNAQCVIRLATTEEVTTKEGLAGKSVAYENGSAGESYASEIEGANTKPVDSQMDAVMEVKAGTVQYAVVDVLLAESLAGQSDFANITINESIQIDVEYYAVGFKKGSDLTAKVNAKFEEYLQNGYMLELAEKYNVTTKLLTDYSSQK